jgi:translation initiation factor IF-1
VERRLNPVCLVKAMICNPSAGNSLEAANNFEATAMSFTNTVSAEQSIELEGTIQTVLPGTMFRVVLDNQHQVLAHISGKMRRHFVRLTVGDRVRMEMSPYDLSKARITYRLR